MGFAEALRVLQVRYDYLGNINYSTWNPVFIIINDSLTIGLVDYTRSVFLLNEYTVVTSVNKFVI